jgi:hypothetical protein
MTTIILKINERTKEGKAFLEMTNALVKDSKGIEIVSNELTAKQKTWIKGLKKSIKEADEIAAGKREGQTLQSFLDEL